MSSVTANVRSGSRVNPPFKCERTGRFREICDQIGACTQYSRVGDVNICNGFANDTPDVLSMTRYIDRDVSWWGQEYSGYAIPDNIPSQLLDQVNINPNYWCENNKTISCSPTTEDVDCGTGPLSNCIQADEDIRLAYSAGTCNSDVTPPPPGGSCYVGTCEDSGFACSNDNECDTTTNEDCLIGRCEYTAENLTCQTTADCSSAPGFTCQNGLCKDQNFVSSSCSPNGPNGCSTFPGNPNLIGQCILRETSFEGGCYNNSCLVASDGTPFTPTFTNAVECKAYPEQNSPYPHQVEGGSEPGVLTPTNIVTKWVDPATGSTPVPYATLQPLLDMLPQNVKDWTAYTTRPGYQGIDTCAPNGGDCSCTYQKVTYGTGIKTKYYDRDAIPVDFLTGVCLGGGEEGKECIDDTGCNLTGGVTGRCIKPTSVETLLGVDGYCLERDTGINKWKDPNNMFGGECLTWLPVDQLTGSNDIYNNYTEAGALLAEDAFYCAETSLYADLFVTGSTAPGSPSNTISNGCAESKSGIEACEAEQYDDCSDNAHCPKGYFAIVGTCNLSSLLAPLDSCTSDDGDDNCPYFCVPEGSVRASDGTPCSYPDGISGVSNTLSSFNNPPASSTTVPGWITPLRKVGSSFGALAESYATCEKRGVRVTGTYDADTEYIRLTPQVEFGATDGYWQGNSDEYYLGCRELLQVSGVQEENKAWTNRLWQNSAFAIQSTPTPLRQSYTSSTSPENYGRVLDDLLERDGENLVSPEDDMRPISIMECLNTVPTPTSHYIGLVSGGTDPMTCQSVSTYPYALPEARSYERIFANVPPTIGVGDACDDQEGCNEGVWCSQTIDGNSGTPDAFGDGYPCFMTCNSSSPNPCRVDTNPAANAETWVTFGSCQPAGQLNPSVSMSPTESICSIPTSYDHCGQGDIDSGNPTSRQISRWGVCYGTANLDGAPCYYNRDCRSFACVESGGVLGEQRCITAGLATSLPTVDEPGESSTGNLVSIERIKQLFAKSIAAFNFNNNNGHGAYVPTTTSPTIRIYDTAEDPSSYEFSDTAGTAPIVRGLDDCFSAGCREATDDTITVNGVTGGEILGDFGAVHVSVQFFAEANENQLPIRNAIVNFGDGHQSGSTGDANYYKNRRGLLPPPNTTGTYCNQGEKWGETSESCEPNYFTFTHDYVCTTQMISEAGLPSCDSTSADLSDGCRTSDGLCEYIPRVHVKDNWGYCTGECGTNTSPAGTVCYDDTEGSGTNECQIECDADSDDSECEANGTYANVNPWISFDGQVRVEP